MRGVEVSGGHHRKVVSASLSRKDAEDEDHRIFHWDGWLTVYGNALAAMAEEVFNLIPASQITAGRKHRADAVARRKLCLGALAANLAACTLSPGNYAALAVPLKKGKWTRYDNSAFTTEVLSAAIQGMKALGLITLIAATAHQTRTHIVPTASFINLLARHGVSLQDVGRSAGGETILLRRRDSTDGTISLRDYTDDATTEAMRRDMEAVNETLNFADIRLDGHPVPPIHLVRIFQMEGEPTAPQRFDRNGRIYRGFWIDLPKDQRHLMTIGGETISDLDFSAMHLRLAYARQGAAMPDGDLYAIPGLEACRQEVKRLTSSMFSRSKPAQRLPAGVAERLPRGWTMPRFVSAMAAHHPAIAPLFCTGVGLEFMALEASIMISVLLRLADEGIACLPIHDGLMCAQRHKETAVETMERIGLEMAGCRLPVVEKIIARPVCK